MPRGCSQTQLTSGETGLEPGSPYSEVWDLGVSLFSSRGPGGPGGPSLDESEATCRLIQEGRALGRSSRPHFCQGDPW